jgi:hypothetical protein
MVIEEHMYIFIIENLLDRCRINKHLFKNCNILKLNQSCYGINFRLNRFDYCSTKRKKIGQGPAGRALEELTESGGGRVSRTVRRSGAAGDGQPGLRDGRARDGRRRRSSSGRDGRDGPAGEKRVSGGGGRGRKGEAAAARERSHRGGNGFSETAAAGSLPVSYLISVLFP